MCNQHEVLISECQMAEAYIHPDDDSEEENSEDKEEDEMDADWFGSLFSLRVLK